MNLAVNARDAMPRGGRLMIRTSTVKSVNDVEAGGGGEAMPGCHVLLAVSDTGHGMSEDVRARIFEPFFTTKPVGKGTGLGLATVYGIVKQSGGHIWVETHPGQGTTFKICLPIIDAPEAEDDIEQDDPARGPRGSELVLLVEDNESVRGLARDALTRSGYRVIEARNGEEALQLASAHLQQIGLLLTDVVMPIMGGRELADNLATRRPGLKIIFTSGHTDDDEVRQGTPEHGATFLQKPFTPAQLGRTVREVLDAPQVV
jgi:two-component system cell cycle sensor histidine kinase/response regulator CckA